MKKYKLSLVSMIVFMSVFSLTVIFNTPFSYTVTKGEQNKAGETVATASGSIAEVTEEPVIHSFSYDIDISSYDDSQYSDEDYESSDMDAEADDNEPEADDAITANDATPTTVPEATLTPVPEVTPTSEPKEESKYANIGISIAKDYVNIREKASTDSKVVGKLYKNSACEIKDSSDGWYHIESGSVTGYANSDYIKTGIPDDELLSKYGTLSISVACDGLNVRDEKSKDAKKLTVIYTNEIYPVVKDEGEWIKIKIPDEGIAGGYVMSEYTNLIVEFKEAVSKEEEALLKAMAAEEAAKKETQIKKRESVDYDYDELQLLACLIHAEAGSQTYETKLAVANVVLNRIRSSGFPNNMIDVIYQYGQFTVAASGSLQKQLDRYDHYSSKAEQITIKAAKDALAGSNNIGSRIHFYTYSVAIRKGYDNKPKAVKMGGLLFW
jgi:uncharacterized protein YgiM (DUF1202 family)